MNRSKRRVIAQETLAILENGGYETPSGKWVDLKDLLEKAEVGTEVFPPEWDSKNSGSASFETKITVHNETTFSAARRLAAICELPNIAALNFASAKNPGGGFLNGSQAQEEALARASGLYSCLLNARTYYDTNRACSSSIYTDHIIYSPDVPVFRDDNDEVLDQPYNVSIVTAPAVNAGAVRRNEPENSSQISTRLFQRMKRILGISRSKGIDHLILGAWGCGVFQNDPAEVASLFRKALESAEFADVFQSITFAVLDRTEDQKTFSAFESEFTSA